MRDAETDQLTNPKWICRVDLQKRMLVMDLDDPSSWNILDLC